MKKFEHCLFLLGKTLKAQTYITKKQNEKLDNAFELDKIIKKANQHLKNMID